MKQYSEAFVGFDTAKKKHAVAIADVGREGEIRYLGEIDATAVLRSNASEAAAARRSDLRVSVEASRPGEDAGL
jgi:transposase